MQKPSLVVFHNFFAVAAENWLSKAGPFIYIATFPLFFLQNSVEFSGNIISRFLRKMPHYAAKYSSDSCKHPVKENPEIPVEKSKFSTLSTGFSTRFFLSSFPIKLMHFRLHNSFPQLSTFFAFFPGENYTQRPFRQTSKKGLDSYFPRFVSPVGLVLTVSDPVL